MVNNKSNALDTVFSALSDSTRRAILLRLMRGEAGVTELAAPFGISLPAISRHLRVLEHAGLIDREIQGRSHSVRLRAEPLRDAATWLTHYHRFWESQFDALERYLNHPSEKENPSWPKQKQKKIHPLPQPHHPSAA